MPQFVEALRGQYAVEVVEGQRLVECALIIAVVVIVAMVFLQGQVDGLCSQVNNSLAAGPDVAAAVGRARAAAPPPDLHRRVLD